MINTISVHVEVEFCLVTVNMSIFFCWFMKFANNMLVSSPCIRCGLLLEPGQGPGGFTQHMIYSAHDPHRTTENGVKHYGTKNYCCTFNVHMQSLSK